MKGTDAVQAGVDVGPLASREPASAAAAPSQPEFIPLPDDDDGDADDSDSSTSEEPDSADGAYEFGSPPASEDSSSWDDSDEEEETHASIDRDALPAWLSRRRKKDRSERALLSSGAPN